MDDFELVWRSTGPFLNTVFGIYNYCE